LCTLKKILKGMGENVPEEKSLKGIDNCAVFFPQWLPVLRKPGRPRHLAFMSMDARLQTTVLGKT
jgi:hypothetical protein